MRLRDVARIELGAQDYSIAGRFNGKPGADYRGFFNYPDPMPSMPRTASRS